MDDGQPFELIDLAGGARMEVRPTTAADAERILSLYETLSVGDRHRRFFGAFRPVPTAVPPKANSNTISKAFVKARLPLSNC